MTVTDLRTQQGSWFYDEKERYAGSIKVPCLPKESSVEGWFDDVEATLDRYKEHAARVKSWANAGLRCSYSPLCIGKKRYEILLKKIVLSGFKLSVAEHRFVLSQLESEADTSWKNFMGGLYIRNREMQCSQTGFNAKALNGPLSEKAAVP